MPAITIVLAVVFAVSCSDEPSPATPEDETMDVTAPTVPQDVRANPVSSSQINVAWSASTDNEQVAGYRVFRNDTEITDTDQTSYEDTGLDPETEYTYEVIAYDETGNESRRSTTVRATTMAELPDPDTQAPSVPQGVTATGVSTTQIDLSWSASTDNVAVAGYRIVRDEVTISATDLTTFSDTGLDPETSYSYRISAFDAVGNESGRSTPAVGTTHPELTEPDVLAPSVPQNVTASAVSATRIDLSWSASVDNIGVTGYRIFRDNVAIDETEETNYSDAGLSPGTTYNYQVSAYDEATNESDRSDPASATTSSGDNVYLVGPSRAYTSIQQVRSMLQPGDLVLVDGDHVYTGGFAFSNAGTPDQPITIRGVKINGNRPVIEGGRDVVEFNRNHYVFESFEIRNAEFRGLYHHAHDITIRDCVVHDCPHGILGADGGSGSLTVEYCEVYQCGEGTGRHQLYIATNENDYPGSVFRMQFCYVHDGNGGNNVKTRAERNEIYYNWLENPRYHNLELIGPDPAGGVAVDAAREDSDVVGNVIIAERYSRNVRIGGDGTGQSYGRYRFMNNTFIHRRSDARSHIFGHFDVESVEMHNNVFYMTSYTVLDDSECNWVYGRRVSGTNNWVHSGANYPGEWTGTLTGTDPGLADIAGNLLRPEAGSVLINSGTSTTNSPAGSPFPNPLALPACHPPEARLIPVGTAELRPSVGTIDIGAFEFE
jgi:chitodextrinase